MSVDHPADMDKKTKRVRVNFTELQVNTMEAVFTQSQYPDVTVLEVLSDKLDLRLEKICTWFQNRRSKFRRESKKGHIEWMRKQLFMPDGPSAGIKESVLTPVVQNHQELEVKQKQNPMVNIHHFPEFQHNILPLSTTQEHLTSHNVGCIIPPTDQNLRNTTNNNLTRPSCYYVNYKQHCNEVRSQVVSSVSSSTTSTSWSCTAPNMSTPQKYLNQKKYGSISPQGVRKINSYHAYQYNQLFPGFECPVYATETNNNENIDVTPASGSAKCQNTFNNCHFHGPVTF